MAKSTWQPKIPKFQQSRMVERTHLCRYSKARIKEESSILYAKLHYIFSIKHIYPHIPQLNLQLQKAQQGGDKIRNDRP